MKRTYHHYTKWECFNSGFYEIITGDERVEKIQSVIEMFNSEQCTEKYMNKAINLWPNSCDHFLSNVSNNRIAYIGQAACCIYDEVPNLVTMEAWKVLDYSVQKRSNNIAQLLILKWEKLKKLETKSRSGKIEAMREGYQMRLIESWKNGILYLATG